MLLGSCCTLSIDLYTKQLLEPGYCKSQGKQSKDIAASLESATRETESQIVHHKVCIC